MFKTDKTPIPIKFFCWNCKKIIADCQCPDLAERFARYRGSVLEEEAAQAVKQVRGIDIKTIAPSTPLPTTLNISRERLGYKRCRRCGRSKPLSEFYKNQSTKDGYENGCKECRREGYYRRKKAV